MTNKDEPTLADIVQQIQAMQNRLGEFEQRVDQRFEEFEQKMDRRFEKLELRFCFLETRFDSIENRFTNLDNRIADLAIRQIQDSSVFFGVGIVLLSAAITFVVASY